MPDKEPPATGGTKDGTGAADPDQPYQFGNMATFLRPHPFSDVEFARLLVVRGRLRAANEQVDPPKAK